MGSDISLFVEYRKPGSAEWHCMGDRLTLPRDYELFTLLMDGFRGKTLPNAIPERKTPSDLSIWAQHRDWLYRATWCSVDEFRRALSEYECITSPNWIPSEFYAKRTQALDVAALAMRAGYEVRYVYGFD